MKNFLEIKITQNIFSINYVKYYFCTKHYFTSYNKNLKNNLRFSVKIRSGEFQTFYDTG